MKQPIKYVWAIGLSLVLGVSLLLDTDSKWRPLLNQIIDVMQQKELYPRDRQ